MNVLTDGLERIQRNYSAHITLAYEDPLTFGGGHFVLYPTGNTRSRFTIEEQYTGTDWSTLTGSPPPGRGAQNVISRSRTARIRGELPRAAKSNPKM